MFVFVNGKFVSDEKAAISVFDRSFLYGDGLFETMRVYNGRPFCWPQHMDRLQQGADFLKIRLPFGPKQLLAFAEILIKKNKKPDSLLRITLSRGSGALGYSPKHANKPTLVMFLRPTPGTDQNVRWKLLTSSFRLPSKETLACFKTCNKLAQVLARAEADAAGADEALLLNTSGHVVEGASSNLFWVKDGAICTSPLAAGILAGVTRTVIFEIASKLKIPVREKNIRPQDLAQVDGVFLSLSSFGIVEAKSMDRKVLKKSPLTWLIASAYRDKLINSSTCNRSPEP